jgi:hypothetical protein
LTATAAPRYKLSSTGAAQAAPPIRTPTVSHDTFDCIAAGARRLAAARGLGLLLLTRP